MTDVIDKIKTQTPKQYQVAQPFNPETPQQFVHERLTTDGRTLEESRMDPPTTAPTWGVGKKSSGDTGDYFLFGGTLLQKIVIVAFLAIALIVAYGAWITFFGG